MSVDSDKQSDQFLLGWEEQLSPYACGTCQGVFLIPPASSKERCPYCHHEGLMSLGADLFSDQDLYTQQPEGYLSSQLGQEKLQQQLEKFKNEIPFKPEDLTLEKLKQRSSLIYLPIWWVDVSTQAVWNAEMGFDYQVVSHQEYFNNEQWETKEHLRTQVRWEERLGKIDFTFDNTPVPAMEHWEELIAAIGDFPVQQALPYQAEKLKGTAYQFPSIVPKDAWATAAPTLHKLAAHTCKEAASAQHVRRFHWQPEFGKQTWTQVLVPVYTSYYLDDEQQVHPILIHGLTGKLIGRKRASVKRAKRIASIMGLIGLAILATIVGGGLMGEYLAPQEAIGVGSVLVTLLAILVFSRVPKARSFNQQQPLSDIWSF